MDVGHKMSVYEWFGKSHYFFLKDALEWHQTGVSFDNILGDSSSGKGAKL